MRQHSRDDTASMDGIVVAEAVTVPVGHTRGFGHLGGRKRLGIEVHSGTDDCKCLGGGMPINANDIRTLVSTTVDTAIAFRCPPRTVCRSPSAEAEPAGQSLWGRTVKGHNGAVCDGRASIKPLRHTGPYRPTFMIGQFAIKTLQHGGQFCQESQL